MSDRRKRQLPLVKCEDGVERYTRDNKDGVMRWDEREGTRRILEVESLADPVVTQTTSTPGDGSYWHECAICQGVMKDHTHGYGECVERRGTTGHDARGRRHEDTHNCVRYTPLTWDRRKRTRRGGRRK